MNLVFNEISFLPHTENEHTLKQNFLVLIKTFEKAKELYGFTHFVFPTNIGILQVTPNRTFLEWAYSIAHAGDKNKILSVVKRPFGNEVLGEKVGDLSNYFYVNADAGIPETYCSGLATAYVKESLCSSLSSMPFWEAKKIEFQKIINDDLDTEQVSVNNISTEEHFEDADIKTFIEYLGDVNLSETEVDPEDKPIALRDDHGKDKLLAFSKKVRASKYVNSIINSLPFNPKAVNLIKEIYPDGKIEMVLYWEDKGIGIIIQTTGKNYRETEAIAKILKKEFDK
ncbi:MAG: hypothetical protein ABJB11_10090 [Ferruginibacter sp.]